MAARVEFLVATKYDGSGFNSAVAGATKLDAAQKKATASGSKLADTVGKVSTTLARSVGIFGLSSTSLRALDDAADIAELGLKGVEGGFNSAVKGSQLFSAATLGAVGAAAALGAGLGTLLRWLGETEFGMNTLGLSTQKLDADFRRLFGIVEAGPDQSFAAAMGASNLEAIQKQIESLRKAGASIDDIIKTSGAGMKRVLGGLAEADQIKKLQEWGFTIEEAKRIVPGLTDNLKPLTDAQREAARAAEEHAKELERMAEAALKAFEDQALSASMADEERLLEEVERQAKAAEEAFQDLEKAALDAAMAAEQWELDQELEESAKQAELLQEELERAREEAERMKEVRLDMMLEGLVNLVGLFGDAWGRAGEIIADTVKRISEATTATEKAGAIMSGVGQLGGMIGGTAGSAIKGGAAGALTGLAIGGPIGAVVGGIVGVLGGIFGDSKRKAAELKRKQAQAIDAFADLYQQWVAARQDLAMKGAEGVNSLIDSMFEDGEFNEKFTSAANAAEYVAAQFSAMVAAGIPLNEILDKLGPALEAMGEDAKKFAGSAAAPLIQLAKVAKDNQALLQFQQGLADTAVSLATFGLLTQDLATKMSIDLGKSIDELTQKFGGGESGYMQALRLSKDALFKLQQAAEKGQVTLDDHTQKMIDDAKSAGLFEGLQDPMQQLIQINNAMLAAMGQLVSLMGGAVPAAIQAMIDAFNSAQFSAPSGTEGGGGPVGGPNNPPPELPQKPQPQFAEGGYLPERPGGHSVRVGEPGTGGEWMIPDKKLAKLVGDNVTINVYPLPHQDPRHIAEELDHIFRNNTRGHRSQNGLGAR